MLKASYRMLSVPQRFGRFRVGKKYLFLRLVCLALVWLCITSVSSSGQPPDLGILLDKIQQTYERTSALTAKFDQTATLTSLNRQQTSSGRVYIEKPHSIRWEYTQPD